MTGEKCTHAEHIHACECAVRGMDTEEAKEKDHNWINFIC